MFDNHIFPQITEQAGFLGSRRIPKHLLRSVNKILLFNKLQTSLLAGLGPAAVGSAPNAAIFFCTYDTVKRVAVQQLGYQVILSEAEDFLS